MDCVPYRPELSGSLTELVNEHIQRIPPHWTLSQGQVEHILNNPSAWRKHYPEETTPDSREMWCLVDQQQVLAAGQFAYTAAPDPITKNRTGGIDWCFAKPQQPHAVSKLVETIVSQAQAAGLSEISLGRNQFGLGWSGIPDAWMHVSWGLEAGGFQKTSQWMIMQGRTDVSWEKKAVLPKNVTFEWIVDLEAAEWDVCALLNYTMVGECSAWRIPAHFDGCPGSTRWTTLEWIGVEEPYQRQGIGSRLLVEQLRAQRKVGVDDVMVWVETDNLEAVGFFRHFGFEDGPVCRGYERQDLGGD